jgi:AcrR family transcriptional regulator
MSGRGGRRPGVAVSVEQLQREAIRLFGEKSYHVIGVRDIGEAVGILPGSVYAHIKSKEDLLLGIVETGIRNYLDAIEPVATTDEPADVRLRNAIRAHMRVLAGSLEQTKVTFQQWQYLGAANRKKVLKLRQDYENLFMQIVQDGISDGTFRQLPHLKAALLTMIGGLSTATDWYSPAKSDAPEEIADAIADFFLGGFGVPAVTRRRRAG